MTGERNRHGFALEFLSRAQARLSENDPRLAGMRLVLGPEGPVRMGPLAQAIRPLMRVRSTAMPTPTLGMRLTGSCRVPT